MQSIAEQTLPIWEYKVNCIKQNALLVVGSYLYYTTIRKVKQIFRPQGEKCLGNLPPDDAEPRSGEAQNGTAKREYSRVLRLLDKIRTHFKENPDAEF